MIHLPVCFGDKFKSKNLEVDFLVVDVPTTYNYSLEKKKEERARKTKEKEEASTSASKGLVASSPAPSPSSGAGINSNSSGSRPSSLACWRSSTGGRPRNSYPPEIPEPTSLRPCTNTPRCQHDPANSLASWFEPPFQPPRSLQPQPSQVPPLAGGVHLDKIGGWPLCTSGPSGSGFPPYGEQRMLWSRQDAPQFTGACRPAGGACGQNNLVRVLPIRDHEERGANKVLRCTFLACWLRWHYLSYSRRRSVSAAACPKVASSVSKTVNLALACSA
ncbi:LOW QUALITY PROTEIN: hypothetical protein Cgig2_019211 [Carnegiea gigantea]|uniref:Uncharacterized protein n=1 Tax=Carnegiea gigantea TaxID=171969 RepID=A0A9Q1JPP4_9CARY|nr:LOW QUALITY PROTEIN: hypothetical protein Cgig2_019211 [Carnegiea gigantea]